MNIDDKAADHFHSGYAKKLSSNTEVTVDKQGVVKLLLYGHTIAQRTNLAYTITNAGYFTRTTKARLNALRGVRVHQHKRVWYLNDIEWNGENIILGVQ